jgi:Ca2+-binding RTX toxin-like protein
MHPTRITLALAAAAFFAAAPAALADTSVSIENGTFGVGLSGKYLFVRDSPSFPFDQRMDVVISESGSSIKITDDVGDMRTPGGDCTLQGAAAFCPAAGLVGMLVQGGNKNDALFNTTTLPSAMHGDSGTDLMQGGADRDQMTGDDGNDTLRGGGGNDSFTLERGQDVITGEGGTGDTISYRDASVPVSVTLGDAATNDGPASEKDNVQFVENATGSPQNDFLEGTNLANVLKGGKGADTLRGLGGNDTLDGGFGGDSIQGGGGAADVVTYADRTEAVAVTLDGSPDDGSDANDGSQDNVDDQVETIEGGAGADALTGSAGPNVINGNLGNDTLDGGGGSDTVNGLGGSDTIKGSPDSDTYDGGIGLDTLDYSSRNEPVEVDLTLVGNDNGGDLDGAAGQRDKTIALENLKGGSADDVLRGTNGDNDITAGLGADIVDARNGDDAVDIDDGVQDTFTDCGLGKDTIAFDFDLDFVDAAGQLLIVNCEGPPTS